MTTGETNKLGWGDKPKMVAEAPAQGTHHADIKALADKAILSRETVVLRNRATAHAEAIGTLLGNGGYADDRMKDTALAVARDLLEKLADA